MCQLSSSSAGFGSVQLNDVAHQCNRVNEASVLGACAFFLEDSSPVAPISQRSHFLVPPLAEVVVW